MSAILAKLDRKEFRNLPEILDAYEHKFDGWRDHTLLDGKNIEGANVEQASWLAYYDEIKVELGTLVKFLDMKERELRGKLTREILDNSNQDHNERTRERLIDADPMYVRMHQNYLLADEVYRMACMIVDQFIQRAYTLNNLVKIHAASIENVTLHIDDR